MKTIIAKTPPSNFIPVSSIHNESVSGKIIVLEQGTNLGLLTHELGYGKDNHKIRRWFFTPFNTSSLSGSFWDGCIETDNVNKFLSIFVGSSDYTKVHMFDTVEEMALWIAGRDKKKA